MPHSPRNIPRSILFWLSFAGAVAGSWASAAAAPLQPSPDAGQVGLLVGQLLSREHYRKQPLDDLVSLQFLTLYLDALDYNHLIFLKSDIQEFQKKYGAILDDETLQGNVQPGFDIFKRYVERVEQRVAQSQELLKENFSFDAPESLLIDRREAPWPANEEEARKLWRQRVKHELLQEKLNKKKVAEARETISRRYQRLLRAVHEEDAESVLQIYLTALAQAYDPHSDYLPPTELNNFSISMKLSLVGIGAILRSDDGYARVIAIVPGGPADLDKRLKVNDRITAVAQGKGSFVDIVDMKLNKAVEMIRGKKDTEVRIQVIPADATDPSTRVEIKLKRDEIKLTEAEAKAKLIEHKGERGNLQRLGYIELPSFYSDVNYGPDSKSTTRDVSRLIEKLQSQKIDGLILDLRRNGGGVLAEALSLTGLFIKKGPVVQIKDSRGRIHVLADDNPSVLYDGPLVVLVSHISASASEILAAALQDYGRAVIVGEQSTFGKGTVQKVEELSRFLPSRNGDAEGGGALKITTQKFYRVSGGSTQYRGVISDIQLPSELDYLKINEATLKNALPYDEVSPADYTPLQRMGSLLPGLRKRSQERVLQDPEFNYIREDMARLKARLEDKAISLNEAQRLREKQADAERAGKRKTERAARKLPSAKTLEITLQSLNGPSPHAPPALTRKVLDDAKANLDDEGETPADRDPSIDPELSEGLHILSDLVERSR